MSSLSEEKLLVNAAVSRRVGFMYGVGVTDGVGVDVDVDVAMASGRVE